MALLKVKLERNLRRTVLQGHPWIYKEAIRPPTPSDLGGRRNPKAQLCQVLDNKGDLAWALYDPHGPLALRILSLEKTPPNKAFFAKRFEQASSFRKKLLNPGLTTAYRLFNGEGDQLPGLICDIYGETAIIQLDGQGPSEFWDREMITQWLLTNTPCRVVQEKMRRSPETAENSKSLRILSPQPSEEVKETTIQENGVKFKINFEKGQKTGFFLDQRDNRNYIRQIARGQRLLNLFSYSGGFSVYAGLGGASQVASLDISAGALELAQENWQMNGLDPKLHTSLSLDVFEYLQGASNAGEALWDHIIVDPPSMTHSEAQKPLAMIKYKELFSAAAKKVGRQGHLSLSSCSGHISFEDFLEIINEALSTARRSGRIHRVAGQGADHPYPHACPELRYLKFVHLVLN